MLRLGLLLLALCAAPGCGDDDYEPPDPTGSNDLAVPDLAGLSDLGDLADPGDASETD